MKGGALQTMYIIVTVVGLYCVALLGLFLFFDWHDFNIPEENKPEHRLNGAFFAPLVIWLAYGCIAIVVELKQRQTWTVRRVSCLLCFLCCLLCFLCADLLFLSSLLFCLCWSSPNCSLSLLKFPFSLLLWLPQKMIVMRISSSFSACR